MDALTTIVSKLKRRLCKHANTGYKLKRLALTGVPLGTDEKFEGVPLRDILSPPLNPMSGVEAEQVFDAWFWPQVTGEGHVEDDITDLVGSSVYYYVAAGKTAAECGLRMLYTLSKLPNATLVCHNEGAMLMVDDRVFGMSKGLIKSRFCEGFQVGKIDARSYMERVPPVHVYNKAFCSLYRESTKYGRAEGRALIAIFQGNPGFNFHRMARESTHAKLPSPRRLETFEKTILEATDPIEKLYFHLVPEYMTKSKFGQVFIPLSRRNPEPDMALRQRYLTRMYHHVHQLKGEE